MEGTVVAQTEEKTLGPIAFVNAVFELRNWAAHQNIACPDPALPNSNTDADESWWLYDEDDKLVAHVGYDSRGVVSVL